VCLVGAQHPRGDCRFEIAHAGSAAFEAVW